ncbi:MAG: YidC/Oxa1 family insertase periplasmic-domain containing protein [Endomicrobiia bacterium]
MEKRVLLATMLSLGVLMLWQIIFVNPSSKISQDTNRQTITQEQVDISKKVGQNEEVSYDEKNYPMTNVDIVEYELGNVKVVFNKFGAGIREIFIKEKSGNNKFLYNLLCRNDFDSLSTFPNIRFDSKMEVINEDYIVTFLAKKDKEIIKKVYRFKDFQSASWVEIDLTLPQEQNVTYSWQHYVYTDEYNKEPNKVFVSQKTELESKKTFLVKKIEKGIFNFPKEISWIGLSGKYFLITFFPQQEVSVEAEIKKFDKNSKTIKLKTSSAQTSYKLKLLITPLSVPVLKSAGEKLIQTIDWGTFAPISKLFYEILVFFNKIFNNYGMAIIGLTIILQLLTFPLTFVSLKSAAHMKQIQPQIQTLQKVYKNDPKRLNSEIMNLYKQQKVNPFSGCLPLILQIPIFWALFTMLRNTYDLRGAEFIFWIKDLSQPDRLFIPGINFGIPVLTLLMGGTMFLQQVFSGSLSDPNQKMVAFIFPVMFTVMFINFPSGLVMYWFVNNLFTIGIQFFINKSMVKQK